jgi:hypothetical protein
MRIEFGNGQIDWNPISYDGECDEEALEFEYQKAIGNKPSTTRYKHIPTGLEYEFVEKGKTGMTVILKHVNSNFEIAAVFVRHLGVKDWKEIK